MIETFNARQLTRKRSALAKARADRLKANASLDRIKEERRDLEITINVIDWNIKGLRAEIIRRRQEMRDE